MEGRALPPRGPRLVLGRRRAFGGRSGAGAAAEALSLFFYDPGPLFYDLVAPLVGAPDAERTEKRNPGRTAS